MVYSLDLREKALNYIANVGNRKEASRIFGVSVSALANWLSRQKRHDLAPKMNGSKPSKIDNDKLKKYIQDHPDSYLREIAAVFNTTVQAVFYACKRIKVTLKKKPLTIKKGTRKNERSLKKN